VVTTEVWQYRTQHASRNFAVNVFWCCMLPTIVLVLGAAEHDAPGGGVLLDLAAIWGIGAAAGLRAARMGVYRTADGFRAVRLVGSRTLPRDLVLAVHTDRVGKQQLVATLESGSLGLPHMVNIGKPRYPWLGFYHQPNYLQRRAVGSRRGPWQTLDAAWGDESLIRMLGAYAESTSQPTEPRRVARASETIPVSLAFTGGLVALVLYAVTDAYAWLGLAGLLVGLAGILLRRLGKH
jgi:hypothetical protein